MEKTKNQKKRFAVIAAVLCLALAAGLGTYAWLTAQSQLTNSFTVGKINDPTTNPDEPGQPLPTDKSKVDGNLTETNWDAAHAKLTPGATIAKNPNVGLGKGSDNAYVFVYVKNALVKDSAKAADTPYFTINNDWTAVTDMAKTTGTDGQYISGLFMYTKGQTQTGEPGLVTAKADADVYTGELFSNVVVPSTLTKEMVNTNDNSKADMTVYSYVFGADQANGEKSAAANALDQAKAWANGLANA